MESYPKTFEEFSGKKGSAARLSLWSFERFKKFLTEAQSNEANMRKLKKEKLIIFLHLLGIDTAGHSDKPHSE